MTDTNPEKPDSPKSQTDNVVLTQLKVFGFALVFGLLAYGVVTLIYFAAEHFGLNG